MHHPNAIDNFRAFRTLGVSATSPWEHDHFWRPREGVDRSRKDLAVDWEDLQRPGFSADYIGRTYERMDLAFGRDDWEPTADGRALLRNNRPRLAYIAGKPGQVTAKDHNARPGEGLSRQLIVLNNSRVPATCEVSWVADLPAPVSGTARVTVPTGEQRRIPVAVPLPDALPPGRYTLRARFDFGDGEVQDDRFALDVLPRPGPATIPSARIAVFDPKGETAALLKALHLAFVPVEADADAGAFELLVVGKGALTVDGPAPRIDRVRDGLRVLVFEQTSRALERRLGFRTVEYGLRQVDPRVPDHPILAGLTADHLHDWRGDATLLPPRLDYERRPMHGPTVRWCDIPVSRAWRCGNRGNVASVLIEKPARGDFLPVVDGGFGLQYSPLLEYREGRGRVVFCQLDVTSRTEPDPAAEAIVRNLMSFASSSTPLHPARAVSYAGDPAGLAHLRSAGIAASRYDGDGLDEDHVLVVAPGAGPILAARRREIAGWLDAGGRLLAIGCDQDELGAVLPPIRTRKAEHIAAFFEPPTAASPLSGVGPADVHNRDPRDLPLVTGGADILGDGVLAATRGPRVVLCQLAPWQFRPDGPSNVRRTYRRAAFLVSRLLGNLGAGGETPLLDRFRTPVAPADPGRRRESGLYLDRPEEWDDPYRFFRW